jgi:hypothetical protein
MFAMDGMMTSMITGGPGVLAFTGVIYCVTRRMQPTGSVQRTPIQGLTGIKVVGFNVLTL